MGQNPFFTSRSTPFSRQDQIVTILWKLVFKQVVGRVKEKSEITRISNKYKDTLDDLIDSLDTKSPN